MKDELVEKGVEYPMTDASLEAATVSARGHLERLLEIQRGRAAMCLVHTRENESTKG